MKSKKESSSNELALSLYVEEVEMEMEVEVEPIVPLKICFPSSIRRSPRFTTNKYKTPSPSSDRRRKPKGLPALPFSVQPRRSPRLSAASSAPAEIGSKKRRRFEEQEEREASKKVKSCLNANILSRDIGVNSSGVLSHRCLRSRTVVMHVGNDKQRVAKSVIFKCLRSRKIEQKLISTPKTSKCRDLQSSPRMSSSLIGVENGNLKPEALALCEPPSPEKSLRSRNVKMQVRIEKEEQEKSVVLVTKGLSSPKEELSLDKSPRVLEKSDFEKCDSELRSEKCLRSRKIEFKVHVEGRDKKKTPKNEVKVKKAIELEKKEKKQKNACSFIGEQEKSVMLVAKGLNSPKEELSLDKSLQVLEKSDFEKCDSELRNEKCLRSRKIEFKVNVEGSVERKTPKNEVKVKKAIELEKKEKKPKNTCSFIGKPILDEEAQQRWEWRYKLKSKSKGRSGKLNGSEEDEIILNVESHYAQAKVGSCILNIGDCAYIRGEGKIKHLGRILEFFKTTEGEDYFRVQWFFRAEDTVMKDAAGFHDKRRLFFSTLTNDNMLDCIISKVNIVKIQPSLSEKPKTIQPAAFYYDMEYSVEYSTFRTLSTGKKCCRFGFPAGALCELILSIASTICISENSVDRNNLCLPKYAGPDDNSITAIPLEILSNGASLKEELALLDLFSGCGGMSTGLCFGANLSGCNLVTKWAVDYDKSACDSLKLNHPETQVRNESANDFLELIRSWEKLCKSYLCDLDRQLEFQPEDDIEEDAQTSEEYEVSCLIDICYGDPGERGKRGLHFKVRWKGYGPDEDTWEPIEELSNCQEKIWDFVKEGLKSKILPLPGDADVICGGPPCQGISGYNRYRNVESPLDDERNQQIIIFMDIVKFLKPKYILMENVVDIIRFDKASLGRYALSRLVHMNYQARLGTIASGCYGLPQFRLRVFIWGASPTEKLPAFPLPTHDVIVRYWPPCEFERNTVGYDEGQPRTIERAVVLGDAISDLPAVENNETREEMEYAKLPETAFQWYIRLSKDEMLGREIGSKHSVLYDHQPLRLSEHDYLRVCQIPHRKGANFRHLPGVVVGEDNTAYRDPTKEPAMLSTGRPVVPDCAFSFEQGKSRRPYARLWWDETVATVVTFPYIRCQAVLHPEQDRILTVREFARLQGFPDFYRFCGNVKEKYRQIGNAVSFPVGRALGYALAISFRKVSGDEPLMTLPPKFSFGHHSSDAQVVSHEQNDDHLLRRYLVV